MSDKTQFYYGFFGYVNPLFWLKTISSAIRRFLRNKPRNISECLLCHMHCFGIDSTWIFQMLWYGWGPEYLGTYN